jgi:hypothetical protein
VQPRSSVPKVMSVCEILQDLRRWSGKDVIIIASMSVTFEGAVLHGSCRGSDAVFLDGEEWPTMIALAASGAIPERTIPIDEETLLQKKRSIDVREGRASPEQRDSGIQEKGSIQFGPVWVAMYGRIVTPQRLIAPTKQRPGNGYGINGSLPAQLRIAGERQL